MKHPLMKFRYFFWVCAIIFGLTAVTGCPGNGGDDDINTPAENQGPGPTDDVTNSFGMTFNLLSAGKFTMGSPETEPLQSDNETQHEVTLSQNFYMQVTEVTQGQWEAVLTEAESREISIGGLSKIPSFFSTCGTDCPVEQVSWDDTQIFINALNQLGEGTYRLPTEAQWEYAARAGSSTAFANGSFNGTDCGKDPNLDKIGWYCYNSRIPGTPEKSTKPVAQKDPNAWDLYDMHGNVWEWCQDWYQLDLGSDPVTDPEGPGSGSFRVIRGGDWYGGAEYCRSAYRDYESPDSSHNGSGFRLTMLPDQ